MLAAPRSHALPIVLAAFGLFAACGGDATPRDAAPADGEIRCTRDLECADGLFCNGDERCDEGRCVSGAAPCERRCDESRQRCLGCEVPDADGDGHAAIECGGDDCDDGDDGRFPGNVETCDSLGRDEDCNEATLGEDRDRDGFVDDRCCNATSAGELRCGEDCDDLRDSVNPRSVDACNERDDDCDGSVDEDPTLVFYVDADGDGWGVAGDPDDASLPDELRPRRACARPDGYVLQPGDCDDEDPRAAPGSLELCGGGDEDCDGATDEYGGDALSPAIDPRLWYVDADRDGWGNTDRVALGCVAPSDGRSYSQRLGDCRDDRPDVNPGVTTPSAVPSCPEGFIDGDVGIPIMPFRCGDGSWQCVDDDRICGRYPFFDAWWDLDCSGALETFPEFQAYTRDELTGECVIFATNRPRPTECGTGSGRPESYGLPTPPDCEPVPLGSLGPVRCR